MNAEAHKKISDLFLEPSSLKQTTTIDQNIQDGFNLFSTKNFCTQNKQGKDLEKLLVLSSKHSTDINNKNLNQNHLILKSQNAHSSTNFNNLLMPESQINQKNFKIPTKLSSSFPDDPETTYISQKQ